MDYWTPLMAEFKRIEQSIGNKDTFVYTDSREVSVRSPFNPAEDASHSFRNWLISLRDIHRYRPLFIKDGDGFLAQFFFRVPAGFDVEDFSKVFCDLYHRQGINLLDKCLNMLVARPVFWLAGAGCKTIIEKDFHDGDKRFGLGLMEIDSERYVLLFGRDYSESKEVALKVAAFLNEMFNK